jgi:hypothetical protein
MIRRATCVTEMLPLYAIPLQGTIVHHVMNYKAGSKEQQSRELATPGLALEAPTRGSRTRGSLAVNYFEGNISSWTSEHPCPER